MGDERAAQGKRDGAGGDHREGQAPPAPPRLSFSLPLDPARLRRARHRIRDYLFQHGVEPAVVEDVVLTIQEAMTNAVTHSDSDQDVEVCVSFCDSDLCIVVRDRGRCFDVAGFDPTVHPSLDRPGGLGLYLMAQLMDDLQLLCDGGLEVRAVKRHVLAPRREPGLRPTPARVHQDAARAALLDEMDEGFYALNWEYRFTGANDFYLRLVGHSRDEVLGRVVWDVYPRLRDHEAGRALRRTMELGQPALLEYYSPTFGHWFELRAYPAPEGLNAYLRDIDERKRKELERDQLFEALRESEQRLRSHLENTPLAVIEWNSDVIITRWAGQAQQIFGWSEAEAVGRSITDLNVVYEDDAAIAEGVLARLAAGASRDVVAPRNVTKDGRVITCTWYSSALRDAAGRVSSVLCLVDDDSERRRAEEALRESEVRFRLFMDHSPAVAWIKDEQGRYVYASRPYRERLRVRGEDWENRTDAELWPADIAEESRRNDLEVLATQRVVEVLEQSSEADGSRSTWLDVRFPLRDAQGRRFVAGIGLDVTARQRAEDALRKSRQLSEALARVASVAGSRLDSEAGLSAAIGAACEGLGCAGALLVAREAEGWRVTHLWGLPESLLDQVVAVAALPQAGLAAREQRPVVVDDHGAQGATGAGASAPWDWSATLTVPLVVQGRSIGCLLFAYRGVPHQSSHEEVDFAVSVAAGVSVALRNARLYAAQRRVATALQQNFVHALPQIEGLETAALSLPAGKPELIGGDFHDVFRISETLVMLLIGDVMGKGIKAAGLTEALRSAARALALVAPSPDQILERLNRLLLAEEAEQFASVLVLTLELATGRCRLASAGHPPPLVVSGGAARRIEPHYGTMLGAFPAHYDVRAFELRTGETLALYTDGLTEARRRHQLFGERRLLEAARRAPDLAPAALAAHLRDVVLGWAGELEDDLDILVLRRTPTRRSDGPA